MKHERASREPRQAGFSLVELLAVVAIIAVMAAVAIPAISRYVINYQIRGAAQEVMRQVDAARIKAISSNANQGVVFVVVDRNSYRIFREDQPAGEQLGPLYDLPGTLVFVAQGTASQVRFSRLGASCSPGAAPCAAAVPTSSLCTSAETSANRCSQGAGINYMTVNAGTSMITVQDAVRPAQVRRIFVSPGGRSFVQS